jgi:pilus assembly protein Flp/PilA
LIDTAASRKALLKLWALGKTIVNKLLGRFLKDESGATAIEYGLIAAGISLAIIGIVSNLGSKLHTTFSSLSTQLR